MRGTIVIHFLGDETESKEVMLFVQGHIAKNGRIRV